MALTVEQSKALARVERGKGSAQDVGAVAALALHRARLDVTDDEAARIVRAAQKVSR